MTRRSSTDGFGNSHGVPRALLALTIGDRRTKDFLAGAIDHHHVRL